jgi:3-oxoacyl-[acyl-carrier-protein] synthase III
MSLPPTYLSAPVVVLPTTRLDNDQVIARVRSNYQGAPQRWPLLEAAMRRVLDRCATGVRYIEEDDTRRVGDFAAKAANGVLEEQGVSPSEVDLFIYGGVAREYFEPSTAMEAAAKCGIEHVHAFDVTSACAGQLEGIHIATSYLAMYEHYRKALVCSAELSRGFLCYDIQSIDELVTKAAGLTIGNAASAWLLSKEPFAGGSLRLLGFRNHSLPGNWHLCSAPIDGTFTSLSTDLFKLNEHVAPEVRALVEQVGWSIEEVDHFVFHQPSESIVLGVLRDLGVDASKGLLTHHLYANTVSTTVSLTMNELLRERGVRAGDKLVLGTAAAGFSMVSAAGVWEA